MPSPDIDNISASNALTPWEDLTSERQLALREDYGHYLDSLPPTCSLDTKIERFRHWLAQHGVDYRG